MKTIQYHSMSVELHYRNQCVCVLTINKVNYTLYPKDGDTLFFLHNSYYMDYMENVPPLNALKLVYKP